MDKRNENSRRAIYSAYMQFLRENPQGRITIDALCAAAKVSKSTFYNNYKNMSEMVADAERRLVRTIVNSVPQQSYTFSRPELFTTEVTLAFARHRSDIRLLFGADGLVRMLYLLEVAVKNEIFSLYPRHRNNPKLNIILTYCIMGAANANILNTQTPFDELVETIGEITEKLQPVMEKAVNGENSR